MIKKKIVDFAFIVLIGSFLASTFYIYYQDQSPNMFLSSVIFSVGAIFVLILQYVKSHSMSKIYILINILVTLMYIFFGFVFSLSMVYASPDYNVYYTESSIFLMATMITGSIICSYLKSESSKLINIGVLVLFIILTLWSISFSMTYTYSSVEGIAKPLSTIIGFIGVSIFVFFSLNTIQKTRSILIKNIYGIFSVLIILYFIIFIFTIIGSSFNLNETYIQLFIGLLALSILLNIYSVGKLYIKQDNTYNND